MGGLEVRGEPVGREGAVAGEHGVEQPAVLGRHVAPGLWRRDLERDGVIGRYADHAVSMVGSIS